MYDPSLHHRRPIRLKSWDYRTPGAYVVTICTHHWVSLFAAVVGGKARLTSAGRMIQQTWDELSDHYSCVDIDAFIVMPNHVHGIVLLLSQGQDQLQPSELSLPDVVHRFKTLTTKRYCDGVEGAGWPRFDGRLWHRNSFERVIRNEAELDRFREYIEGNPSAWEKDPHFPRTVR